jgi:hypothetical protein
LLGKLYFLSFAGRGKFLSLLGREKELSFLSLVSLREELSFLSLVLGHMLREFSFLSTGDQHYIP